MISCMRNHSSTLICCNHFCGRYVYLSIVMSGWDMMTYQQTNVTQTVSLDSAEPVVFYRLRQL